MSVNDVQPERKPLKPGKGYGMASLACGTLSIHFFVQGNLALLPSPFCALAGIIFGVLGRNTEGSFYALIGRALSMLYFITVFTFVAIGIFFL